MLELIYCTRNNGGLKNMFNNWITPGIYTTAAAKMCFQPFDSMAPIDDACIAKIRHSWVSCMIDVASEGTQDVF
jgi:hypothetical protein